MVRAVSVTVLVVVGALSAPRSCGPALGFGEALIAVPLLAFVLPVEIVAPVAALVSITVAVIVLVQDWRHVNLRSAAWLVCSTHVLGHPFLRAAPPSQRFPSRSSKARSAWWWPASPRWHFGGRTPTEQLPNDRLAWLFGVSAGVLAEPTG